MERKLDLPLCRLKFTVNAVIFAILNMLCMPFSSTASEFKSYENHSQARIVVSTKTLSADTLIGLHIKLDPDWHSYWENPGDSGAAPLIQVMKGEQALDVDLQFPIPKRIATPPLYTFGYEQEVLYWFKNPLKNGNENLLTVQAEWLVCKVECIPAFDTFKLEFPRDSAELELFEHWLGNSPKASFVHLAYQTQDGVIAATGLKNVQDFFPLPEQQVLNDPISPTAEGFTALVSPNFVTSGQEIHGLALIKEDNKTSAVKISLVPEKDSSSYLWHILLAFIGGLILNIMPCVFPIISIKILGILSKAGNSRKKVVKESLAYLLGVQTFFSLFALFIFFLQRGGETIGWGFQLQSPTFVSLLCLLFFALGGSFLGWADFSGLPIPRFISNALQKDGSLGQFMSGALAVIVASPCTAPLMGAAMGYAISQPLAGVLGVFWSLGFGFAVPYLLFLPFPDKLPKPGPWLNYIKELMAFPMFLTTIWLIFILGQLTDVWQIVLLLLSLWLVGLAFWTSVFKGRRATLIRGLLILGAVFMAIPDAKHATKSKQEKHESWGSFHPRTFDFSAEENYPLFLVFTADWCITCKVNEKVALKAPSVLDAIAARNIKTFVGDLTHRDPELSNFLRGFSRISVPFYLYYARMGQDPVVLPEVLTPQILIDSFESQAREQ